jgi:ribose 5-phosphate isomerase B
MTDERRKQVVAFGSDHAALELKAQLKEVVADLGFSVEDVGTHDEASCDYPDYAHAVAAGVAAGRYRFGVLICGTGLGMSYAANRHRGVRAAVCSESFSARMARKHNDANVLCLGARVVGSGVAEEVTRAFFEAEFEGGRHVRRVAKIDDPNASGMDA